MPTHEPPDLVVRLTTLAAGVRAAPMPLTRALMNSAIARFLEALAALVHSLLASRPTPAAPAPAPAPAAPPIAEPADPTARRTARLIGQLVAHWLRRPAARRRTRPPAPPAPGCPPTPPSPITRAARPRARVRPPARPPPRDKSPFRPIASACLDCYDIVT